MTSVEDQQVFQPSTFASRKAEAQQKFGHVYRGRRLVSAGTVEQFLEPTGRWGKGKVITVEYLFDQDKPSDRYRRVLPHGQLERLFDITPAEESEPIGVLRAEGFHGPDYRAAPDDPAPVLIT